MERQNYICMVISGRKAEASEILYIFLVLAANIRDPERIKGHGKSPGVLLSGYQNRKCDPSLFGHAKVALDPRSIQIL